MFQSIRRHQKWLWLVITTLTIISFVIFFSPQQTQRGSSQIGSGAVIGTINGRPITREEYLNTYREAELRYLFSTGNWPREDEMSRQMGIMDRETRNRLLLVQKLKEFNIQVSETSIAQWIVEAFQDRATGKFRQEDYDGFIKLRLPQQNLVEADFQRFVRHEVGIQHLIALTGLTGKLITPQEAEIIFRRENEQADTQAVFLQSSNYLSKVVETPADLMTYYTNHQASYRIPERVQVVYVKFDATNYMTEAEQKLVAQTNLTQMIDAEFLQRGTNSFRGTNGLALAPEEAKQKIRDEYRHGAAMFEARKKAIEFANEVLELPAGTNNLANLAAAKGILSTVTDPFSKDGQPPNLKVPDTFVQAAFQLSPAQPFYEQPIVAEDGVYLVGFHKRVPSEVKPFEAVRDQVATEFRKSKANELLNAAGRELQSTLTNSLAQGKTFAAACKEANVEPIDLPPFSQKTLSLPQIANRADLTSLKTTAFSLHTNQVSSFTYSRDSGFIVYLEAKVPVPDERVKTEVREFTDNLRRTRQYEAFGEWMRKEMDLARITLQGDKQPGAN
ncbi:MAG: hypothetical protein FJ398_13850 [Verrucomicrobia bacterium]|nr:hypothetical protein [Verrucomicrobiota bacterium]